MLVYIFPDLGHDFNVPDMDEIEQEPWVPEELQIVSIQWYHL